MEDGWTLAIILIKAGSLCLQPRGCWHRVIPHHSTTQRPNPTRANPLTWWPCSSHSPRFLALHIAAQVGFLAADGLAGMMDQDMINIICLLYTSPSPRDRG